MKMKFIYSLTLLFFSISVWAQNDVKAREAFMEAQTAFDENNFDVALDYLNNAEKLLGAWSPKIGYLKIASLDHMCDYSSADHVYTSQQIKEVAQYLKSATTKTDERYKTVQAVNKKLSLTKKIQQDLVSLDYKTALKLLNEKNYSEATALFKKEAAKGNFMAMYELASANEYTNRGFPFNPSAAWDGYKDLLAKGYFPVAYRLGIYCRVGYENVTKKDRAEALKWFRVASDWDQRATVYIADAYKDGEEVTKDCAQALLWFKKAAFQGDVGSFDKIGDLYGNDCLEEAKSYSEAMRWYKKGIEKGNIYCYGDIAQLFEKGYGVPKDPAMVIEWYKKGAELGDYPKSQLGGYYYEQENYEGAVEWLTKYLDNNTRFDRDDAFKLGILHYYGGFDKSHISGRQDTEKAILYLTRAAKANEKDALEMLVSIYTTGKDGFKRFKNAEKAREWKEKLAGAE
jgi:TPR repeat protein